MINPRFPNVHFTTCLSAIGERMEHHTTVRGVYLHLADFPIRFVSVMFGVGIVDLLRLAAAVTFPTLRLLLQRRD